MLNFSNVFWQFCIGATAINRVEPPVKKKNFNYRFCLKLVLTKLNTMTYMSRVIPNLSVTLSIASIMSDKLSSPSAGLGKFVSMSSVLED